MKLTEDKMRQQRLAGVEKGPEKKIKQMTLRVEDNLHTNFKIKAALENRTINDIVENLMKRYVRGEL